MNRNGNRALGQGRSGKDAGGLIGAKAEVVFQPKGVVGVISPWNFPVNLPSRKLGSALAAGCSVVIKPAEETPASCMLLVRCFLDAGVPPDAINLVWGDPALVSSFLIERPEIAKVSVTGSVAVGKLLGEQAARHVKRFTGELGGHAPVIVAEDADVALAVKTAGGAKFRNAGQVCISPTRFLVHESIAKEFSAALVKHAAGLAVGDGLTEGTQMGPLANPRRVTAMAEFTKDAVERGATLATGGQRIGESGNFWQPTILTDVPLDARVFNDEPFGPMAAVRGFDTLDEAIAEADTGRFISSEAMNAWIDSWDTDAERPMPKADIFPARG